MDPKTEIKKTLLSNKPVLLYDGEDREGETDLMFYPEKMTFREITYLRKNGGGLICIAVSKKHSAQLGIPFLSDLLPPGLSELKFKKSPYGSPSAFSISINHSSTFTGITDQDRANTITEFFRVAQQGNREKFLREFHFPGHVFLLRSSDYPKRRGHTEISTELLSKLGLTPIAVVCEMLDSNGKALSKIKAKKFAKENNLIFLDSQEVDVLR